MHPSLLLIAHGSRQREANEELLQIARDMEQKGDFPIVEASFLELAMPNIDKGGARCIERGADIIVLLPYFLSAGVHVRRDLTQARDRLRVCFPKIEIHLAEPLGPHPLLETIIKERACRAMEAGKGRR